MRLKKPRQKVPGVPPHRPRPHRLPARHGLKALKTALEGDDATDINAKAQDLSQSAMKMGQSIYEKEQANAAAPGADAPKADDGVVDAEFSEVDDNKA